MEGTVTAKIGETREFSELEREIYSTDADNRSLLRKVSDLYFAPKSFERWRNGRIYEILGVKYIQEIIMGTIGRVFRKLGGDEYPGLYFIGKRRNLEALQEFEAKTRVNELLHMPAMILASYASEKFLSWGDYNNAILGGVALLVSVSPTILQRYNRTRLYNVMDRRKKSACPLI